MLAIVCSQWSCFTVDKRKKQHREFKKQSCKLTDSCEIVFVIFDAFSVFKYKGDPCFVNNWLSQGDAHPPLHPRPTLLNQSCSCLAACFLFKLFQNNCSCQEFQWQYFLACLMHNMRAYSCVCMCIPITAACLIKAFNDKKFCASFISVSPHNNIPVLHQKQGIILPLHPGSERRCHHR